MKTVAMGSVSVLNVDDGVGVSSSIVDYAVSDSGTVVPGSPMVDGQGNQILSTDGKPLTDGSWSTTIPTVQQGQYLWTRTRLLHDDGAFDMIYNVSYSGENGSAGSDGASITGIKEQWYLSTSSSSLTGGAWSYEEPSSVPDGKYLWGRLETTLSNGQTKYSDAVYRATIDGLIDITDTINQKITQKIWSTDILSGVQSGINDYDSTTTQAIRDRVTQTETDISGITSRVSATESTLLTKADGSTVTALQNTVTQNKQTADAFQQTVTSTYAKLTDVDSKINNIKVGGHNLYVIEDEVPGFLHGTNGSITSPSSTYKEFTSDYIPVKQGEKYVIQSWCTPNATGESWLAYQYYSNDTGTPLGNRVAKYGKDSGSGVETTADGQEHLTYKITVPANAKYLRISYRHFEDGYAMIEKATTPSEYAINPRDLQSYTDDQVQSVRTYAEQTANKFTWLVESGDSSSNFTLTDRTAQLVSDYINLNGTVTFSAFDTNTQNTITTSNEKATVGLGMKVNYENFSTANAGECYLHGYTNGVAADVDGYVYWNDVKRTVPKKMINPNAIAPYWSTIYIVYRLSSASATTGTLYIVWYNSGWKYAVTPTPSAVGGTWTWAETTDIVLGQFIEPSNEGQIVDAYLYDPPRNASHIQSTGSNSYQYAKNSVDWVSTNGANVLTAKNIINNWATDATQTNTTIKGGLIQTHTILSEALATNAIMSSNYSSGVADSDTPSGAFSQAGSFLDLATGNIYMPNFGVDAVNGAAYINGTVYGTAGHFGADNTSYWNIETVYDYANQPHASLVGVGSPYIQTGNWQVSDNAVSTRKYTSTTDYSGKADYYKDSGTNTFYDVGVKIPTNFAGYNANDNTATRYNKAFFYGRKYTGNTAPSFDSDWTYMFMVDTDGYIYENGTKLSEKYASIDGVSGAYLPLTGGTVTGNLTVNGTLTGTLSGNASTATSATSATTAGKFTSAQSVTLTGDTTGTASSQAGWSIATTTKLFSGTSETDTALTTSPGTGKIRYSYNVSNPTGIFPRTDNSNSIITLNRHSGNYHTQIGLSSNGNIYYRSISGALNNTTPWKTIIDSDNYTNYTASKATADASGNVITSTYRRLDNNIFDTITVTDLSAGDLVVTGAASFTNGLSGDLTGNVTGNATTATTATKVQGNLKIQLNSGTTEGTNQFTYNGEAGKTVNITKGGIGLGNVENTALSTWAGSSNLTTTKVGTLAAAATKGVDTSISSGSSSGNVPTTAAVASFVEGKGYVTSSGVTSVRVQATSPVVSSTNTAQTSTLNTTISLADAYGDTKNPYGTKTPNYVLAGPSSGTTNAAPSFRALVAADIPSLTKSKISDFPTTWALSSVSGADDLKAIEALTGTSGFLKKTAANTWTLDTNTYVTSSGVTSITLSAGEGISLNATGAITSTGTRTITNSGVRAVTESTTNGSISVNTNGTTIDVAVHGLGDLAYKDSLAKGDVGLGSVTNNRQVKGLPSNTTEGHFVLWGTDGYTVTDGGIGKGDVVAGVQISGSKLTITKADGTSSESDVTIIASQASGATILTDASSTGLSVGDASHPTYFASGIPVQGNVIPTITLNGTANTSPSFFAPTAKGSSGQVLKSNGNNTVSWMNQSDLSVGSATNATNATNATTATNVSTQGASTSNENRHVWFSSSTETKRAHDDDFKYNPSTNTLTVANVTGNAGTATKWASAQTVYVALGTASKTTSIQGGSSSAVTLGVDGTLGVANGGTGKASWTQWGILYASASTTLANTGAGSAGQVLQSNGSSAPTWITATNSNTASTIVKRDGSGNFSAGTITAALTGNATSASKFNSSRTISLSGDVSGSASGDGSSGWSITTTVADNSHNHDSTTIVPIATKTYTDVIAAANDEAKGQLYFIKVLPDSYTGQWEIHYKVSATITGVSAANGNGHEDSDVYISGMRDTYAAYKTWNNISNTSYRPYYYHCLYRAKEAGITGGYGHALGINLRYSWNPATAANVRTVTFEIIETKGCTVTFFDAPSIYANLPGTGTTNYDNYTNFDATTQGRTMTGDRNDVNYYNRNYYGSRVAAAAVYRYQLCLTKKDRSLLPINSVNNSIATDKVLTTETFDPFGDILYWSSTTTYAAGANVGDGWYSQYLADIRYSFNIGGYQTASTLVARKPLYLVATPQADGTAILHSSPLAQDLPTTEDGLIYIYLGQVYQDTNPYRLYLTILHPVYYYIDGGIQLYTRKALASTNAEFLTHKTVNNTSLHNTAGTFAFSGSGDPWSGTDWVGLQVGDSADKFQITVNSSNHMLLRHNDSGGTNASWQNWVTMLDSSNYNSYSPKLDGTGATGTWGIGISGLAAKATADADGKTISSTYAKLSGATFTGAVTGTSFGASNYVTVNSGKSGTAGGLSLFDTDPTNYGIAMRLTSDQGQHGFVQGDYATYFMMKGNGTNVPSSLTRGWVFKNVSTQKGVASIAGDGSAAFDGQVAIGTTGTDIVGSCSLVMDRDLGCLNFVFN